MMFSHLKREVKDIEYAFEAFTSKDRYRNMKPSLLKKIELQACSSTTSLLFFAIWLLAQITCSEPKVCLVAKEFECFKSWT
jgi:hypothetical protein